MSGIDSAFGGSGADRIFALVSSLTSGDRIDGGDGSVDIVFRMGGMSAAGQLTASDFI